MKAAEQTPREDRGPHPKAFGPFVIDEQRGRLLRDGAVVDLTPRAFAVLAYLVARAGELVGKAELLAAVWPHVVVEESNLSQAIYVIRRALGDSPDDRRYIVTVPGRGYRFVAPVTSLDPPPPGHEVALPGPGMAPANEAVVAAPPAANPAPDAAAEGASPSASAPRGMVVTQRVWAVAALLLLVAVAIVATVARSRPPPAAAGPASIAVLPFVDLSPGRDQGYFADGLAEDVLNLLAGTPDLRVVARTSSFSLRGTGIDVATIGRRLEVSHVLEGSVRRIGGRLRVTAQLVSTRDAEPVWSEAYDRDATDVLGVQGEIAAAVARALRAKLRSSVTVATPRPIDGRAYESELRGRFYFGRRAPGDLERALGAYREALAIEPRYARAWAGLAAALYLPVAEGRVPFDEGLPGAMAAARRAIELDPGLAEPHVRLALCHFLRGEDALGKAELERARNIDPDDPLLLGVQAGGLAQEGRYAEAVELQRRVVALDPLSTVALMNLASYHFDSGDLDAARAELLKIVDLDPESDAAEMLGKSALLQRDYDEARRWFARSRNPLARAQGEALVNIALGRTRDADAALARLTALAAERDAFAIAEVHAYRGDADAAFEWLYRAWPSATPPTVNAPNPSAKLPPERVPWTMTRSPFVASLRADARWRAWAGPDG